MALMAASLKVANMHEANFARAVQEFGLADVEILPVDRRHCLITDSRIPRAWLRARPCPCCTPRDLAAQLLADQPDLFRPADAAHAAEPPNGLGGQVRAPWDLEDSSPLS